MIKRLEPYAKWIYLITIFVLLVGASVYFFLLLPLKGEVQEEKFQVLQLQNELVQLAASAEETSIDEDADIRAKLAQKIPVTPSVPDIIRDVERIEQEAHVEIQNISFNVDTVSTDTMEEIFSSSSGMLESQERFEQLQPSTVTFTMEFVGEYVRFLEFVKQFEELPRTNWTHQLYFEQRATHSNDPSTLTATLTISAFYLDQLAAYGDIER